jgi:LuxR family transcriptional regulator, quorum-sensing system regulator CciR
MLPFERAEPFFRQFFAVGSSDELADLLDCVTRELGFRYWALTHHVDIRRHPEQAIRLHNYPGEWAEYYDANSLGLSDPVHRASHVTTLGFAWSRIPELIALTPRDRDILAKGGVNGLGDGFTVPAHVPGESHGSCSFANPAGIPLPEDDLPLAQLLGSFAFEAARRLWRVRPAAPAAQLTDRQRECLIWVARGKTDWEIAQILGVAHHTVVMHLKQARDRFGGGKRTSLVAQALYDTSISFPDIFRR